MKISAAIKEYLVEIEIRQYTWKTLKSYRLNLGLYERFMAESEGLFEVEDITLATTRHFSKFMLDKGSSGAYVNGLLKTIKSFIQYCYEEGYGGFNTKKTFKWCKEEKAVIRAFTPDDVKQMMSHARGNTYMDIRDTAILTLFFETGIRAYELCCIKPQDVHEDWLLIHGKGHKERIAPISAVLKKALMRYEREKARYFHDKSPEPYYFLSFHGKQLTNSSLEKLLHRHGEDIEGVRVSPHTCRHFFAQQQLKMGVDVYTISRLLGHENIGITQTYLNSLRDEDIIQVAKQRSVLLSL